MRKIFYLIMMFSFIAFIGCDDETTDADKFSNSAPEEHKKELQEDAVAVISKLEVIPELEAVQVMQELVVILEELELFDDFDFSRVVSPILKATKQMGNAPQFISSASGFSFTDEFDEIAGNYVLNVETGELDYSPNDTEFRVQFNSEVVGACEFVVYGLGVTEVSNNMIASEFSQLPTGLKAYLKAGVLTLLEMDFAASYASDDTPSKVDFSLAVSPLKTTLNYKGNSTSTSFDFSFKEGKSEIIGMHFDTKGNFDLDMIEEMIEAEFDNEEEAILSQEIIDEANVWVAIGNLKADAFIDFKGIKEPLRMSLDLEKNSTMAEFESIVSGFNKNVKSFLRYKDSNKVIAKGEYYVYSSEIMGYNYYELDYDFVFSDGSAVNDAFLTEAFGEYIHFISFVLDNDEWLDELMSGDTDWMF